MSRSKLCFPSALFPFESAAAVSSNIDESWSAPLNLVAGDPSSLSVPLAFPRMGMADPCFKESVFTLWASSFGFSDVVHASPFTFRVFFCGDFRVFQLFSTCPAQGVSWCLCCDAYAMRMPAYVLVVLLFLVRGLFERACLRVFYG